MVITLFLRPLGALARIGRVQSRLIGIRGVPGAVAHWSVTAHAAQTSHTVCAGSRFGESPMNTRPGKTRSSSELVLVDD